jgi:hypothetical protein
MAGLIFINYRRSANVVQAQLLALVLQRELGESRVFLDLEGLDGADRYPRKLQRKIDEAAVIISLIGKDWAQIKDAKGKRRLDNVNDFVRLESARALSRDIPALPGIDRRRQDAGIPRIAGRASGVDV